METNAVAGRSLKRTANCCLWATGDIASHQHFQKQLFTHLLRLAGEHVARDPRLVLKSGRETRFLLNYRSA